MRLIFLTVLLLSGRCLAGEIASFYSSTEPKVVAVLSDSALEKEPEIDHFEHLCPGYGGYELLHRSGDARSWIDVRHNGKTSDLYQATMEAGRGHFVFKQNDIVEWRGEEARRYGKALKDGAPIFLPAKRISR